MQCHGTSPASDDVQHTVILTSIILSIFMFRVTACVQYRECQICLALVPAQRLSEHMKDCSIRSVKMMHYQT